MSSTGYPTLTIDVAARRSERFIAAAVLLLVLTATFQLQRPIQTLLLVTACAAISIAGSFWVLGWFAGGRRVVRIVCQPDGRWVLYEASGQTTERELSTASRVGALAVWLQWRGGMGQPLLLLPGDIAAPDLRRLVMRLRLMPMTPTDEPSA